jgi:serine/threonine protein kinase
LIQIGDFGLAKELEGDEETTQSRSSGSGDSNSDLTCGIGTASYAAPEQLERRSYSFKVDIYSLGIIFFELFSSFGTYAERARMLKELKRGNMPCSIMNKFPKEMEMVQWMMSTNPDERPSATQLLGTKLFASLEADEATILRQQQDARIRELEQQLQKLQVAPLSDSPEPQRASVNSGSLPL